MVSCAQSKDINLSAQVAHAEVRRHGLTLTGHTALREVSRGRGGKLRAWQLASQHVQFSNFLIAFWRVKVSFQVPHEPPLWVARLCRAKYCNCNCTVTVLEYSPPCA
jgi:hypothetical protein